MFDFVRTHTRLFQGILVLLVFPSFVFFGVQGYSSFRDGGMREVASVDGQGITRNEWDMAHQRAIEQLRQRNPNVDVKTFDTPQARQESLEALLRERTLMAAARRQHLLPSDARLAQRFRTDAAYAQLRNTDGSLNREALQAIGKTSEGLAQELRVRIGSEQISETVGRSAAIAKAVQDSATRALMQRREVQLQRFETAEQIAKVAPTEADLEVYYRANEAELRLPETAQIEYVVLDLAALSAGIDVSEAQLKDYYEQNASRFAVAEERRASHILIAADKDKPAAERQKAKARAEELLAELRKSPAKFAELARANSQDPASAAKGGDLGFFARGVMVKAFDDAAFAMKPGEIGNVVETEYGYHIIRLDALRGGDKKGFDAVRGEIETDVRRQLAQRKFAESAEGFQNMVYEQSDSLQPVIDKFRLKKQAATVGRAPAPGAAGPLASAKLLDAVFKDDVVRNKRNTEAVDLGSSQLVAARIVQHNPARTPPLAEIKDKVAAAVQLQQAAALARKQGEAKLAELKAKPDTSLPTTLTLARLQPQSLPPQAIDAILQASPAQLPSIFGVDLGNQGYIVVKLTKVLPPEDSAQATAIASQLLPLYAQAESSAMVQALKARYKAEISSEAKAAAAAASTASAAK